MRHKSTLTLAKSIIDNLLLCTNNSGKVTKSMHFADQLSTLDTECRDTPKHHYVVLEVNKNAWFGCFTDQPAQSAGGRTHLKATAY